MNDFRNEIFCLMVENGKDQPIRPMDYLARHITFCDRKRAEKRAREFDKTKPDPNGKYIVVQFRNNPIQDARRKKK